MAKKKIKIPDVEYCAAFESKVVKSGNGGVINAYKKYIGKDVFVLIKSDINDIVDKEWIKKHQSS